MDFNVAKSGGKIMRITGNIDFPSEIKASAQLKNSTGENFLTRFENKRTFMEKL